MPGLMIKLFILAFFVFILTDMVWLGLIAKSYYFHHYEPWLRLSGGQLKPLWWAAILVYLLFALSIVVFIIPLAHNSAVYGALYGAVLGAVIYGVYNFTCLAIFKNFPIGMGFVDWIWGTVLYAWSSAVTIYLGHYLK